MGEGYVVRSIKKGEGLMVKILPKRVYRSKQKEEFLKVEGEGHKFVKMSEGDMKRKSGKN